MAVVEYAKDAKTLEIDERFWVHESSRFLFTPKKNNKVEYRLVAISCEHSKGKIHIPLVFRVHSKKYVLKTLKSWRETTRKLHFEEFPAKTIWSAGSNYKPRPCQRAPGILVSIEGISSMRSIPCHCALFGNSLSYIPLENPETPNWLNFSLSEKTDVSFNGQSIAVTLHNGVPITLILDFVKVPQGTASAWHLALKQSIELARNGFDNEESRLDDVYVRYGTHACRRSLSLKRGVLQVGSRETRFGLTPQCMLRNGSHPASIEIVFHRSHEPFFHKEEQQNADMNFLKLRFSNQAHANVWREKLSAALQRCEDIFRESFSVDNVGIYIPPGAFASSTVGSDVLPPVSTLLDQFRYPRDLTQPLIWQPKTLDQVGNSPGKEVLALVLLDSYASAVQHTPTDVLKAHKIRCDLDLAAQLRKWKHGTVFVSFAPSPDAMEFETEFESDSEPEPNASEANSTDPTMTKVVSLVTHWNDGWLNLRGEVEFTRFISLQGNQIVFRKFVDGPILSTYELTEESVITCDAQNSVIQVSNLAELSDDGTRTLVPEPITFVCVSDIDLGKDPQSDARRWELVLKRAVSQLSWPETPGGEKPRATSITVGSFEQFSMKRDRFHMWMSDYETKPLKSGKKVVAILGDGEMYGEGGADVVLSVEVKGQPDEAKTFKVISDTTVHVKGEYLVVMDLMPEDAASTEEDFSPGTWNHFLILKTAVGAKRKNSSSYQENIITNWQQLLESAISGKRSFMPMKEVVSHTMATIPVSPGEHDPFSELARIASSYALPSNDGDESDEEKEQLDAFANALVTYLQRRRLQAFLARHSNATLDEVDPAKILQSFFQRKGEIAADPTSVLYQSLDAVLSAQSKEAQSASSDAEGTADSDSDEQVNTAKRKARIAKLVQRSFDEIYKNLVFRDPHTGEEVDVVQLAVDMLQELFWQQDTVLDRLKIRAVKALPTYSWASGNGAIREGWMVVKEWFGMDLGEHGQTLRFCRVKDHSFICGINENDVPKMSGQPWRVQLSENDLVEAHGRRLRLVVNPGGKQFAIELSCASKAAAALWEHSFKVTFGTPADVLVSSTLIVDADEPSSWRSARPMMCKINTEELVVHDGSSTGSFPHQILLHADTIPGDPLALLVVTEGPEDDSDDISLYRDDESSASTTFRSLSNPVSLRLRAENKDVLNRWLEVFYKIVAVKGSRLNKAAIRKTVNKQIIYFKTHPGSAGLPGLTPQGPCVDDEAIATEILDNDIEGTNGDHQDTDAGSVIDDNGDKEACFMGGYLHIGGAAVEAGALTDTKLWNKVRKGKGRKVLREIWMSSCNLDAARLGELSTQMMQTNSGWWLDLNFIVERRTTTLLLTRDPTMQLAEAELWRRVVRLDLTDTRLDDAGAHVLAKAFTPDKKGDASMQLMYLHLNNNRIGDLGATHIAEFVCEAPTLASLSLSRNRLRDSGAGAIFQAMLCEQDAEVGELDSTDDVPTAGVSSAQLTGGSSRSVRGLTSLDLSHNSMTTAGAAVLASVLVDPKSRKATRIIDLSQNHIADFGAAALVSAAVKSNVQMLNLAQNDVGDVGAKHIASLLGTFATGTSLSNLNLSGNKLADDTLRELHGLFQKSSVNVNFKSELFGGSRPPELLKTKI